MSILISKRKWALRHAAALLALSLLAAILACPTAQAQGRGSIEGKLVNKTDAAIVCAGVNLDVVGLGGGMSVVNHRNRMPPDVSGSMACNRRAADGPG